jgi:hypothetical protein
MLPLFALVYFAFKYGICPFEGVELLIGRKTEKDKSGRKKKRKKKKGRGKERKKIYKTSSFSFTGYQVEIRLIS